MFEFMREEYVDASDGTPSLGRARFAACDCAESVCTSADAAWTKTQSRCLSTWTRRLPPPWRTPFEQEL